MQKASFLKTRLISCMPSEIFQEILEKRRQLVVQFENYREKKEEEFAEYKDRRLALRDGKYTYVLSQLTRKIVLCHV